MYHFEKVTDPNIKLKMSDYEQFTAKKATHYKQNVFQKHLRDKEFSSHSCYECGIPEDMAVPGTNECYQIFEGPSGLNKHRVIDYITECLGESYIGGCSKRFLDVGETYNERGCRDIPPIVGFSIASKRFAGLELVFETIKNGWTTSPATALVPFSRTISLYTRFHVCL